MELIGAKMSSRAMAQTRRQHPIHMPWLATPLSFAGSPQAADHPIPAKYTLVVPSCHWDRSKFLSILPSTGATGELEKVIRTNKALKEQD